MKFKDLSIEEFKKDVDKFLSQYTPSQLMDMIIESNNLKIDSKDKL